MKIILWDQVRKAGVTLALFGLMVAMPNVASANSIDFLGEGKAGIVSIHSPGLGNLTTWAGELDWAWIGAPPAGQAQNFFTYCVDVNNWVRDPQDVTLNPSTNTLTIAGVTDAGAKAAWLVETYAKLIHGSAAYTGDDAAALQLAIWEALYDSTPDLTSGNFYVFSPYTSAGVITKAQAFLSALFPASGGYNTSTTVWLDATPENGQDQIIPMPEPASLLLCGSGLLLGAHALARRRKARVS